MNDENTRNWFQLFTKNFLEFRDSIYDIQNGFGDLEMSERVSQAKTEEENQKKIESYESEIAKYEAILNDPNSTEEQKASAKSNIEDWKKFIKELKSSSKDNDKAITQKETDYREMLREAIKKMTNSMQIRGFNSQYRNVFDYIRDNLKSQMMNIEGRLSLLSQDLRGANGVDAKNAIRKQIDELQAEYGRLNKLMADFDEKAQGFTELLDSLQNKYIKNGRGVDAHDLAQKINILDDLAKYFDDNLMEDTLTVNFKQLSDGTMSVEMRCGKFRVSPNPIIKPTDDVEKEIMMLMNSFAFEYSNETGKSIAAITGEKVRVKVNGEDKAKVDFSDVPAYGNSVMLGKEFEAPEIDEPAPEVPTPGEPTPTEPAPESPAPGEPAPTEPAPGTPQPGEPAPGEGMPEPPTPGEPTPTEPAPGTPQPGEPAPGEGMPEPPIPGEPTPTEPAPGTPQPGEPAPSAPGVPPVDNNRGINLDEADMHAIKVTNRRAANKQMFKNAASILGTAAIGLGFAGATLGFGLAPAAVAGGAFLASTGVELLTKLKENIKFAATKHKFKKIAKRVEKELDILIEPKFDTKRRDCGFILVDEDGNQLSDGYLNSEDMRQSLPQGLDDRIIEIFDEEFERANKYRGLGDNASTIKQIRYREFPKITFDNAKAAFNEFGGVKSASELNGFKFSSDKYVADIQTNRNDEDDFVRDVSEAILREESELGGPEPAPGAPMPEGPQPVDPIEPAPAPAEPVPGEPQPEEQQPREGMPEPPTPGEPTPAAPADGTPVPAEPAPEAPQPGEPAPAEPAPSEPVPGAPMPEGPQPVDPIEPAPAPAEPVPGEPAPQDPSVSPEILAMMAGLEQSGQSVLPEAQPGTQDALSPNEQVVQVVKNLVANIGLDNLTFENIKAELMNQVEAGLFTADQADSYVAELEAQDLIDEQEKAALNEMINNMAGMFASESKGMGL